MSFYNSSRTKLLCLARASLNILHKSKSLLGLKFSTWSRVNLEFPIAPVSISKVSLADGWSGN